MSWCAICAYLLFNSDSTYIARYYTAQGGYQISRYYCVIAGGPTIRCDSGKVYSFEEANVEFPDRGMLMGARSC